MWEIACKNKCSCVIRVVQVTRQRLPIKNGSNLAMRKKLLNKGKKELGIKSASGKFTKFYQTENRLKTSFLLLVSTRCGQAKKKK